MKLSLLLLPLLAVPCVLCSYKVAAGTHADTTVNKPLETSADHLAIVELVFSEEEINAFKAGYEGDIAEWDKLNKSNLAAGYCCGAAAAGRTELVQECLDKGVDSGAALFGAAFGGHHQIVQSMLDKGAHPGWALAGASLGGAYGYCEVVA